MAAWEFILGSVLGPCFCSRVGAFLPGWFYPDDAVIGGHYILPGSIENFDLIAGR